MQDTQKLFLTGALLLMGGPAALLPAVSAQTDTTTLSKADTTTLHIGKVNMDYDKAAITPSFAHLTGHVKITSEDYDLSAADIKLYSAPGSKAGASGLQQAVAEGGAAPSGQVVAHIRQPLQSEDFEIDSDRAVYLPDRSRPSGGTMKFTGHVKLTTKSGFLAEPSVTTTDTATVLLGAGSEYPSVSTGPGHLTLTPAQ